MNFSPAIRQALGGYLALALVLVPMLGSMHGIVHGHAHGALQINATVNGDDSVYGAALAGVAADHDFGQPASAAPDAHDDDHEHDHEHHGEAPAAWLEALFSGHSQAEDCLVFDQMCQAQATGFVPLMALTAGPPSAFLVSLAGDFIARWVALFQARGPPSLR